MVRIPIDHNLRFVLTLFDFSGQLKTLLEPELACQDLVTKFLDETHNYRTLAWSFQRSKILTAASSGISWLNDFAIGRYGDATEALVEVSTSEADLAQKKVRARSTARLERHTNTQDSLCSALPSSRKSRKRRQKTSTPTPCRPPSRVPSPRRAPCRPSR